MARATPSPAAAPGPVGPVGPPPAPGRDGLEARSRARHLAILLGALAALLYLPSIAGGFVWDDVRYVLENPHIADFDLGTFRWALTAFHVSNWHPLTWLSHALDVQLFGYEPGGHHAVNMVLHGLNAALLALLFHRLTGALAASLFAAALFAFHPINVETVAWIAERKSLLSTFFMLLTLHAYLGYVKHPTGGRYFLVALAFVAGLASKPAVVPLPFALLLLDFWPLRRLDRGAWVEKIPLFLLAAGSIALTLRAQALTSTVAIDLGTRIENAIVSYGRYLQHAVWPASLSPYYPYRGIIEPPFSVWAVPIAGGVLFAITFVAIWQLRRRPYLFVGWAFYLGMLVPVIGLVQVGRQAMADRYAYVPLWGIFLALCILASEWTRKRASTGIAAGAIVCVALAVCSWRQTAVWESEESLWTRAVEGAPASPVPHFNLALALEERGELKEALRMLEVSLGDPDPELVAATHTRRGLLLKQLGRRQEALAEMGAAARVQPGVAVRHGNYANALWELGMTEQAEREYRAALASPTEDVADTARIHRNYAAFLLEQQRNAQALQQSLEAVRLNRVPENYEVLVGAYAKSGKLAEAAATVREALDAFPGHAGLLRTASDLQRFSVQERQGE